MEQAELFTAEKVRNPRTEEQKEKQREYDRKWYASRSEEQKERRRKKQEEYRASRSEEQKQRDRASKKNWYTSMSKEQKEKYLEKKREYHASRSEEQKQRDRKSRGRYLKSLDLDGLRLVKIGQMYRHAKNRAKDRDLPFNIIKQDIADVWPKDDYCPALRIALKIRRGRGGPTDNSPNLDRIIPHLGYVKGNIAVVSRLANQIMSSARPSEVIKVGKWFDEKYYEVKDKLNV